MSRRASLLIGLSVLGAVMAFVLLRNLGTATVYFKTADEAVAERAELGNDRFRLEGTVVPDTVLTKGESVSFSVEENGASVDVVHRGDPPELFRPGIPVVLEGHFSGRVFESDRMMVRHSSEYKEKNPERFEDEPATR